MDRSVYNALASAKRISEKQFAVLVDPEKARRDTLLHLVEKAELCGADFIFVGGSTLVTDTLDQCVETVKSNCSLPVVLFPGSNKQVHPAADALLLLSLISGRNAEWLINQHVEAAFRLKESGLEIIPTGYILVDGGRETSVSYVSQTRPIPSDKPVIAAATALAGVQLGMKLIYMDAGSGALRPVPPKVIRAVRQEVNVPLVIGGGIDSAAKARNACAAGADVVVVGNALEKDPALLQRLAAAVHERMEVREP